MSRRKQIGNGGIPVAIFALFSACTQPAWPAGSYTGSYTVVTAESELRVLAYRAGPLAGLGHNHVAVTRSVSGTVKLREPVAASSLALSFPVASLVLDEPDARADEGSAFEGEIPADDIEATRRNMLGPDLLEADEHPLIRIDAGEVSGALPGLTLLARIMIKGQQQLLEVPVSVHPFDGGLVAAGRLRVTHAALGLEPFRVALGSLRVADEIVIRFRIVAREDGE